MSRIFLAHSSRDNFEAIALRDWLASEGWKDVFLDLDPERGIAAGERWERALHAAASRCEAVIFLVSGNWLASGWCLKEYALARGLNKKLFAALIDPTKTIGSLPAELTGVWQIVNLVPGQDLKLFAAQLPGSREERRISYSQSGLQRLKRGLEKAGLDPSFFAWPPESEPHRAPYRGLKPLEAEDAGIFFGRNAPIVEAIDRIRGLRASAPPRLMAILGASGAGKSSFLRAGLLPRLERDAAQFLPLPTVRPERAALTGETGLVNALAAILRKHTRADVRRATLSGAEALRPLLVEQVKAAVTLRVAGDETDRLPTIVVAIDQAEELFQEEGRNESEALLALLADLANGDDPAVVVIFNIRSDSYDALQNTRALEGLRQVGFSLLPMSRGAYVEVIEGPAARVEEAGGKLTIEPVLTQRLLIDIEAGAGDALPLLAFSLEQLYLDYRQTGALRLADYERSGGLKGAIDAAVERAFIRADPNPRIPVDREARLTLLRRGLIPWLAGIDPESRTPRRNIARRADIPVESLPLLDLLAEERLLSRDTRVARDPVTGQETRDSTMEPAHEALLRQWPLLNSWLNEDFALLSALEGIKRAARDWDANARDDSWLTHHGMRLRDVQTLETRPDIAAHLDATDRAYLAACYAREEAERAEVEQRQQEREEERARRLADAQRLADTQMLVAAGRWRVQFASAALAVAVTTLGAIELGVFVYYALTKRTSAIWEVHFTAQEAAVICAGLIASVWALVVLFLYWRDPGRLVRWFEALPDPVVVGDATTVFDRATFGAYSVLNLFARGSLLFLGTSSRALEAWVKQRRDVASNLFSSRPSVRDRRIAIDLPLRIDGMRHVEPWGELGRLLSSNAPIVMHISGPGGAGKTTLACQIARRMLGTDDRHRLSTSPLLPLFVELDVPDEAGKPDGLYRYLAGLLRSAVNEKRQISVTLTKALLRSGRVLVFVDAMSERSETTRTAFNPLSLGFEINRLIATSREPELPGMTVVVETETIPTGALFDFIERYLREAEKNSEGRLPSEDRILEVCLDLKRLLGDTPCTPLLATMWAKEIGSGSEEFRPRDVAGLMDSYIRRVLLPAANGNETLVDRLTKDASRIAERELGDRYLPTALTRATALEVMSALDPSDPNIRFRVLERSRLLEASSRYSDAVRISPDPVAEHLVARLRVEKFASDVPSWRTFLVQFQKRNTASGFLAALAACSEHNVYGAPVPQLIRQRIKQLRDNGPEVKAVA